MNHFIVKEFVSPKVYAVHGERAIKFIDYKLRETMDFIREKSGRRITINNWAFGGRLTQRGLRENLCQIVRDKTEGDELYLSAHVLGKADDFDMEGMTADEVRTWLYTIKDELPYKIRLEADVEWVHLDVIDEPQNPKIYMF